VQISQNEKKSKDERLPYVTKDDILTEMHSETTPLKSQRNETNNLSLRSKK
jgi:hypothetical protein